MLSSIPAPVRTVHNTPLSASSFDAFGVVIENPDSSTALEELSLRSSLSLNDPANAEDLGYGDKSVESPSRSSIPEASSPTVSSFIPPTSAPVFRYPWSSTDHPSTPTATLANQNTALKYPSVSPLTHLYSQSPSQTPARTSVNLFACFPRVLTQAGESRVFPVRILERHPFTTQTFIPMGLASADPSTKYLVIVAPTLRPKGIFRDRGPPDLDNVRAFMAHGGQGVTYAAGTWHAPMVVVGSKKVDFVVVQFCSGVAAEDCEEIALEGEGLRVVMDLSNPT